MTWTIPRKGSGKENIAICLCRSLNSRTSSPAQIKNEPCLFVTFRLESEVVFSQGDLKKHWKGVQHHASRSDLDAYTESLQNLENLSTTLWMESSVCLKLCWQSWEPRLPIHTPRDTSGLHHTTIAIGSLCVPHVLQIWTLTMHRHDLV